MEFTGELQTGAWIGIGSAASRKCWRLIGYIDAPLWTRGVGQNAADRRHHVVKTGAPLRAVSAPEVSGSDPGYFLATV